jgi:hypothetical protein
MEAMATDRKWLVPYLVLLLPVGVGAQTGKYIGSLACRNCHAGVYDRWKNTRMANVVLDPKVHPEAIIPDLTKPDPLLTFKKEDIAFIYGSKWKQR